MANMVHPNSKQAIVAYMRKTLANQVRILNELGFSYEEAEDALRLVKRNGMTAWELANPKKNSPPPKPKWLCVSCSKEPTSSKGGLCIGCSV